MFELKKLLLKLKTRTRKIIFNVPFLGEWIEKKYFQRRWETELRLLNGEDFSNNTHPSIVHLTLNRSASQWVKSVLRRCAIQNGMVHVRWNEMAFNSEYPFLDSLDTVEEYEHILHPKGYLYSAFGGYPKGIPELERYKIVLLVRDPRDILVSRYFSKRDSHKPPPPESNKREQFLRERENVRQMTVDEFVLDKSPELLADYECYLNDLLPSHPDVHLTRYEDMVDDVERWLDRLLSYVELSVSNELRAEIIEEAQSIQSKEEEKMDHNRKAKPGDHREKLQSTTIAELNEEFSQVLNRFGYR